MNVIYSVDCHTCGSILDIFTHYKTFAHRKQMLLCSFTEDINAHSL